MTAYKGPTSKKFKYLLHNNRLYSSFKDIDLFFLEKESLALF